MTTTMKIKLGECRLCAMRVLGRRDDGTLALLVDGGMAVVLYANRCSPPVHPDEVWALGGFHEVAGVDPTFRYELRRRLDYATTVPLVTFELGGTGSGNFGHAGRPGAVGGSGEGEGDPLSYSKLKERDFKVSKVEAAIIMKRSIKAEKAAEVLRDAIAQDEQSYGPEVKVIHAALDILRRRVIPRALLTVQEDEEPLIID